MPIFSRSFLAELTNTALKQKNKTKQKIKTLDRFTYILFAGLCGMKLLAELFALSGITLLILLRKKKKKKKEKKKEVEKERRPSRAETNIRSAEKINGRKTARRKRRRLANITCYNIRRLRASLSTRRSHYDVSRGKGLGILIGTRYEVTSISMQGEWN